MCTFDLCFQCSVRTQMCLKGWKQRWWSWMTFQAVRAHEVRNWSMVECVIYKQLFLVSISNNTEWCEKRYSNVPIFCIVHPICPIPFRLCCQFISKIFFFVFLMFLSSVCIYVLPVNTVPLMSMVQNIKIFQHFTASTNIVGGKMRTAIHQSEAIMCHLLDCPLHCGSSMCSVPSFFSLFDFCTSYGHLKMKSE